MTIEQFLKEEQCFKHLKWVEVIQQENLAVNLDAMYIVEKDKDYCYLIFVDSRGNKRKLQASSSGEVLDYVTKNNPEIINSTKTFTEPQIIQDYKYEGYLPKEHIKITDGDKTFDNRFLQMHLLGNNLFSSLEFDEETYENFGELYMSKYLGIGSNIYQDHQGVSDYRPDHPAHDSFVGVGYNLGKGIKDGTNVVMMGIGNMHRNDVDFVDSLVVIGKGNSNAIPLPYTSTVDPNRVVNPYSFPALNIRDFMNQMVVLGNENWCMDWNQSVIIGSNNKRYKYFHRSIVIGTENQNFLGHTPHGEQLAMDNDIVIGNGLHRGATQYKPTHNLIIGSTGNSDLDYVPLLEGYMKHDDNPYFGINGRLELRNTDSNELMGHSDNLIDVSSITGFTEEIENSVFSITETSGNITTTQSVQSGKTYILIVRSLEWSTGIWSYALGSIVDNNDPQTGSPNGQSYTSNKLFTATANANLVLNTTANSTGKLELTLYELDLTTISDSILSVIDSEKNVTFEARFSKSTLNNIFLGKQVGQKAVTATNNIGLGHKALSRVISMPNNTVVGVEAVSEGEVPRNVSAFGYRALKKYTNGRNSAFGANSQEFNENGVNNASFGNLSLQNITTGENSSFGDGSLISLNTGVGFTAVGFLAGNTSTTGTGSIFIGRRSQSLTPDTTNEIVIGDNTVGKGNNTVTIGNSQITDIYFSGLLHGQFVMEYDDDFDII